MTALLGKAGNGQIAEEQAALRRVATLVARGAPPADVFAAVTEEAGQLLGADFAATCRYGPDGTVTVVATWGSTGAAALGTRRSIGGWNVPTLVFQTGRPARIDDFVGASGAIAEVDRGFDVRSEVGVPVSVEGHMWGVMAVAARAGPLSAGTEGQLAGFTELAGTAIANAEAQAALTASRARIVTTADAARRRVERNLHDGAQQRLVSLALDLRAAEAAATAGLVPELDRIATGLDDVLEELREIARGLHPAILSEGGLPPAVKALARRSALPVDLDIQVAGRLPEQVETAAYYTVSEALTNAAKHARATIADVQVAESDGVLHLRVRDNGRGGANFSQGSGLVGLRDRAEALGGHLWCDSPPEKGTTLEIALPFDNPGRPQLPPEAADPGQQSDWPLQLGSGGQTAPVLSRRARSPSLGVVRWMSSDGEWVIELIRVTAANGRDDERLRVFHHGLKVDDARDWEGVERLGVDIADLRES